MATMTRDAQEAALGLLSIGHGTTAFSSYLPQDSFLTRSTPAAALPLDTDLGDDEQQS
jgi:hypothetical protein